MKTTLSNILETPWLKVFLEELPDVQFHKFPANLNLKLNYRLDSILSQFHPIDTSTTYEYFSKIHCNIFLSLDYIIIIIIIIVVVVVIIIITITITIIPKTALFYL
jgi:hypothetical protein